MMRAWRGLTRDLVLPVLLFGIISACSDSTAVDGNGGLSIVHAPDTAGVPGWQLRDTLVVRAVDGGGAAVTGARVQWTVQLGDGVVTPLADTTNAAGEAAALWTLGQAGANRLRVSTPDGDSVIFAVNASVFRADDFDSDYKLGCGLVSGAVWCWGIEAGIDDSPSIGPSIALFPDEGGRTVLADNSRQYVGIAVRSGSFCALESAGSLWCGTPSLASDGSEHFTMTQATGLPALSSVIATDDYSLGRTYCGLAVADSTAWCIDSQDQGTAVPGSPALVSLVAGDGWFCGLRADSAAACWGDGPLGDGVTQSSPTPIEVAGGHRFRKLRSDATYACGLSDGNEVYCWAAGEAPVLMATGVDDLAVDLDMVMVLEGNTVREFAGRDPSEDGVRIDPLTGLDGLAVKQLAPGSMSCVRLMNHDLHCWNELWVNSTAILVFDYSPVQPPPSN